jgi:outer membrane immunogenic protein
MTRFVVGALALLAAGWSIQAEAADYNYNPGAPLTVYHRLSDVNSWAGLYLGGNFGYAWGSVDNAWAKPSGFIGGAQVGYNWKQLNSPWLFGVQADIQGSSADDTFANWKFSNRWFGTVRGRGGYVFNSGYAFNNVLFYGTLGLAFGELRAATFGLSESHTNVGWTAGVGAEYSFAPNWSAKIEYLYVDLANSNFVITGASHGLSFGIVRAGVNYRFTAR